MSVRALDRYEDHRLNCQAQGLGLVDSEDGEPLAWLNL